MAREECLYLRSVNLSDAEFLYQWRNDEDVRKNAFHTEQLVYEDHLSWLKSTLYGKSSVYFYILMDADIAVGQIRMNEQDNGDGLITYSIGREHRSNGYGKQIIRLFEEEMMKKNKKIKLIAYVKKHNIASQKVFEYRGFWRKEEQDFFVYEKIV